MAENEYRFGILEERIENHKKEIAEIRERQMRTEMSVNEFHLMFERHSTKLDHILQLIEDDKKKAEDNRKNKKEWVKWIPNVLFGAFAVFMAIMGKVA